MPNIIDLSGNTFGKVIVLERAKNDSRNNTMWKCRCLSCGREFVTRAKTLRSGEIYSCGCLRQKRATEASVKACTKHGATHRGTKNEKLYNVWLRMKSRCNNPKVDNYKYYGGRGITVCEEWQHDYTAFRNWALSNGYQEGLSIDRINVNGNYEPNNCRWISMAEQQKNKRRR